MAAMSDFAPEAAIQQTTPCQTFGCDPRLPESGHVFIELGTAEIGTLLPFPGDKANGRLWSTKLPKQHVRFQVAAEGHFMTATREF